MTAVDPDAHYPDDLGPDPDDDLRPLDLGDPDLNAALARVFESGLLRRTFDRLQDERRP